jgi:hypothetical protein
VRDVLPGGRRGLPPGEGAERVQGSGFEYDVGCRQEPFQHGVQVAVILEAHHALTRVPVQVVRSACGSAAGVLDANDVGSQADEQPTGRTSQVVGQVEDAKRGRGDHRASGGWAADSASQASAGRPRLRSAVRETLRLALRGNESWILTKRGSACLASRPTQ